MTKRPAFFICQEKDARPLEISTKSKETVGINLSAFNLRLNNQTLENIFRSAKVFTNGGSYPDLLDVPPKAAKLELLYRY